MKEELNGHPLIPEELLAIKTMAEAEKFIAEHCHKKEPFHQYLNRKMSERGVSVPELMRKSCVNKNYGYNIVNGARKKPSRDKIIALCVASKMTLKEVQQALLLAQEGLLYWCDERDVRIAVAINTGISDVMQLNIMLSEKGIAPLDV